MFGLGKDLGKDDSAGVVEVGPLAGFIAVWTEGYMAWGTCSTLSVERGPGPEVSCLRLETVIMVITSHCIPGSGCCNTDKGLV